MLGDIAPKLLSLLPTSRDFFLKNQHLAYGKKSYKTPIDYWHLNLLQQNLTKLHYVIDSRASPTLCMKN